MRVFISQPMEGKTKKEIEADRDFACTLLEKTGHVVENRYIELPPKSMDGALLYLGESIKILSCCDVLLYIGERDRNTKLPRGCEAEIHCAGSYGIPVLYGKEGLRRLCFIGLQESI
jgi:hypothetical protein